jgi:hypothetical protein
MHKLQKARRFFGRISTTIVVAAIILFGLWGEAGADPSTQSGRWLGPPGLTNNPEWTARVFTGDVVLEAILAGPQFELNTMMTALPDSDSPAYADILVEPKDNFLSCEGGPFALCYYSGPDGSLPCDTRTNDPLSKCKCIEIPYGTYYVDIHAILDVDTYRQTIDYCGQSGSKCKRKNQAPVCSIINANKLFPGADLISVFSFACAIENNIGSFQCPQAVYAGCMTAPCYRDSEDLDTVTCTCPNFKGPYQVGQTLENKSQCFLGKKNVWSAAYLLPQNSDGGSDVTFPTPDRCIPDDPNPDVACPLLLPPPLPDYPTLTGSELCQQACQEYTQCTRDEGVEVGFVCDAALCTQQCDDLGLVKQACSGLSPAKCQLDSIIAVEEIAQCSCCASQICGCEANTVTNEEIYAVNQAQRDVGIVPQCDINQTLCGEQPPAQ